MANKGVDPDGSRCENGSDFHWMQYEATANQPPWQKGAAFFGCGRDAFRALLLYGQANHGWKRLWIPSYFCQEVVESMLSTGISGAVYQSGPLEGRMNIPLKSLQAADVFLNINLFGLRAADPIPQIYDAGIEVIENHTHDPLSNWAQSSRADWCIVSLRKSLPVPDGGVVWSPTGKSLPPVPPSTAERRDASLNKLAAMLLKSLYLRGHEIDKEVFRRLAVHGESRMASGEHSGMPEWTLSILSTLPMDTWREHKRSNHVTLSRALENLSWLTVLQPEDARKSCPFSAIVLFDSAERRSRVKNGLIASSVYPAVLWPLDEPAITGVSAKDVDFSRRMLSIHCDMRYGNADMERIASLVRQFGGD